MRFLPGHIKAVIFDIDGTLVETKTGAKFRKSPDDWQWLPGRKEYLQFLYQQQGLKLGMATNQGGVGMDYSELKGQDVELICEFVKMAQETGCFPDPKCIQVCFTHPDANYKPELYQVKNDRMRKPNPGMLQELTHFFKVNPYEALYVGDRPEDEQAAHSAGLHFEWAEDFFKVS